MRARLLLALALIGGALGGAAWWWTSRESPAGAVDDPSLTAARSATTSVAPVAQPVAPESAAEPIVPTRTNAEDSKSSKHWWDGFFSGKRERAESEDAKEAKVAIDGVVVVVDAEGREHREESGTFISVHYGPPLERQLKDGPSSQSEGLSQPGTVGRSWRNGEKSTVEGGCFHVEAPANSWFGATKLVLGGRPAVVDSEPAAIAAGTTVTIRAHWLDGVRVRVLDRATHAELDDVTVVRKVQAFEVAAGDGEPGDDTALETVVKRGRSPVLVPPKQTTDGPEPSSFVWIRARDHAWHGLRIDFDDISDRTVELSPAATLVVVVAGELPAAPAAPMLRLRRPTPRESFDDLMKAALVQYDKAKPSDFPGGRKPSLDEYRRKLETMRDQYEARSSVDEMVSERPAKLGETRIESIAPEGVVVSLEVGEAYRSPLVLASASVTPAAGATTRVELRAMKVEAPVAAPLAGTIFVPSGWDVGKLRLDFEPVDLKGPADSDDRELPSSQWSSAGGGAGWYRWDAGSVRPAKYLIKIDGTGLVKSVVVSPTGRTDVELVVPDAVTLRVRLVDAASGRSVEMNDLHWQPEQDDASYFGFDTVGLDYSMWTKSYDGCVPAGRGALFSMAQEEWTFDRETSSANLHAGEQELVARVHRSCGLIAALSCEGARVAWDDRQAFAVEIAPVDGVSHMTWMTMRGSLPQVGVSDPGRYTVKLPALDGFEPVAPFEVEIPAGEYLTKTVELKRKR